MKSFGEIIRQERKEKKIILRKAGAELNIDEATISKLERGERRATKKQVIRFANFYDLNEHDLLIAWLSDKLIYDLENETLAQEALKVALHRIKHNELKAKDDKSSQGVLGTS